MAETIRTDGTAVDSGEVKETDPALLAGFTSSRVHWMARLVGRHSWEVVVTTTSGEHAVIRLGTDWRGRITHLEGPL